MQTMTQFEAESLARAAVGDFSYRESYTDRWTRGYPIITHWTFSKQRGYGIRANTWDRGYQTGRQSQPGRYPSEF